MFKWRLVELMGAYQEATGKRLSARDLAKELGMSKNPIADIAGNRAGRVNLNRPLTTNDLLQYEPDNE